MGKGRKRRRGGLCERKLVCLRQNRREALWLPNPEDKLAIHELGSFEADSAGQVPKSKRSGSSVVPADWINFTPGWNVQGKEVLWYGDGTSGLSWESMLRYGSTKGAESTYVGTS